MVTAGLRAGQDSSRAGAAGTASGWRRAGRFTQLVTGPYALVMLVAVFVSIALTGDVFPDVGTAKGLTYAGEHAAVMRVDYLLDGLEHVTFFVTFAAVAAVLRRRWPVYAALLLSGAVWQLLAGLAKTFISLAANPQLGSAYRAATDKSSALAAGLVAAGMRQGLEQLDTLGVEICWLLLAVLPSATGMPRVVRWLSVIMTVIFWINLALSPAVPLILINWLILPVWAFFLGRWLLQPEAEETAA